MHYLETLELGVEGEDEEGGLEHHQQGEKAHHGSEATVGQATFLQ